jgi:UPF0755 protein
MSEDRGTDPFNNPDDPAAADRERRRLEREERRRGRGTGGDEEEPRAKPKRRLGRRPKQERAEPTPPPADPAGPPAGGQPAPSPREQAPPVPPEPVEPTQPQTADEEFWDDPASEEVAPAEPPPARPPAGEGRRAVAGGGEGGGFLATLRRHPFRVVGAVFGIVVLWFLFALFQPFHGDGSGRVAVTIPKGASVSEVGDLLDEKDVVSSSTLFQMRVTIEGKRSSLYPGRYVLASGMSYGAAIDALSVVPVKKTTTVTIPEGYTRPQTAQLAAEDGLTGSYMKASVHSKYLDPARYGGKGAKSLEGFLFPDTFETKPGAPAADLVQLQLEDFKRRIKGVDLSYAHSKNLTVYDVVTIASMVQAESGDPAQDELVAAVIYNRLHEGMTLGIDATIRFATGNYESPLTESELAIDSPYNTRTNQGLPPGPIGNPGLAAIEAAANPSKAGYLFYVTKPGACNELTFSKTEEEFEADAARYNSAREAAGGNSPTTCGE